MKKFIIVIMAIVMTLLLAGCQGKAPKPMLSPEGVETIITENILYENTSN